MKKTILTLACGGVVMVATAGDGIKYPITREMHNPLFVEFPSPMYGTDSIGRMYTADASAHVWPDGRLYVYASHDMEPPKGCDRMDRYHVFSTDDMVNWTDHGEILSSYDVKEQSGWGIEGWMWAPDAAYNPANGKYYFYFPHVNEPLPWGGHDWRVGIAVSDSPTGDFHTAGYVEGAPSLIDPCVFVDDDGQPYIYNGGGGQCSGGKLRTDDWTRLDGEMQPMQGLVDFHEGTWVHKYNGKYYLSHSDNHGRDGNQLRYAMSDSPLGPWEDKGVYVYATGCGTIHGSIVEYKGKWYALYHVNNPSGRDELRSVCIDELEYNPDGTIRVVRNWGTPHGEILSSYDVKEQSGWGIEGWMWAPDAAYNPANGKYYFYFPHVNEPLPWGGHDWRVGIAVSDSPTGDFHTAGYVEGAPSLIDPCVFVDDDGQPYIYNGGGGQCSGGKLRTDDWTRLDGEMQPMEGLVDFHEGTWVHKYNGKYYLSHSDNHGRDGNRLRYAMSDSPLGPWEDKGVYVYATGCGTIHGSIVEYKGKWYALYHVNNPSGRDELRSVCIDELEYNPDGTIRVVRNWGTPHDEMPMLPAAGETLSIDAVNYNNGGEHYAYHKNGADAPLTAESKSGKHIADMGKGDWMRYSVNAKGDGRYDITFKVAPKAPETKFHLSANGSDITGEIALDGTSKSFADITIEGVSIGADVEYLDLRADNGVFDIKSITIVPAKN